MDTAEPMLIEQPTILLRWLYPRALWRKNKHRKAIYLTFDDGCIPQSTPFILDTLRQHNIKATFFIVGDNARKYPHLLQQIINEGHTIGNHTYNHYSGAKHNLREYIQNVQKADQLLHTKLFRPPHGIMRPSQYMYLRRQYTIVMWDLVTRDYARKLNATDILNNIKRYTRNGSIITFHDSLKSIDKLRTALPDSINWLKHQGYQFETL